MSQVRQKAERVGEIAGKAVVQLLFSTGKGFTVDGLREKLRAFFREEVRAEVRAVAALSNVELITALLSCNRQLAFVGLQLRIINGVVSLLTTEIRNKALAAYLNEQSGTNRNSGLTTGALEVLACIAFKQPISQAEIDRLFDVDKSAMASPPDPLFPLLCGVSAIHDDVLARGEGRSGGTEPEHRAGDLLRRADAANRVLCRQCFLYVGLALAEGPVEHFGLDRAGRDTVDADALLGEFERSRLREADHGELAGDVNRRAIKAEELFTMAPPPDRSMAGISCFIDNNTPRMLMSQT
jgi:chromosome segregation and condensation protein ScpB